MNPWLVVVLVLFALAILWLVRQTRKAGPRELNERDFELASSLVRVTASDPRAGWQELGRRTHADGLKLRFDRDDDPEAQAYVGSMPIPVMGDPRVRNQAHSSLHADRAEPQDQACLAAVPVEGFPQRPGIGAESDVVGRRGEGSEPESEGSGKKSDQTRVTHDTRSCSSSPGAKTRSRPHGGDPSQNASGPWLRVDERDLRILNGSSVGGDRHMRPLLPPYVMPRANLRRNAPGVVPVRRRNVRVR